MEGQQGFVVGLAALAAALAAVHTVARVAARSLVGLVVMVIGEDIASVVAVAVVVGDSIAAGVAGRAVERIVHYLEVVSGVEGENMADREAPI